MNYVSQHNAAGLGAHEQAQAGRYEEYILGRMATSYLPHDISPIFHL